MRTRRSPVTKAAAAGPACERRPGGSAGGTGTGSARRSRAARRATTAPRRPCRRRGRGSRRAGRRAPSSGAGCASAARRCGGGGRRTGRATRRGTPATTPRPVKTGSWSIANGTSRPRAPGSSQRSPSSVIACTAIATSPASARCSCSFTTPRPRTSRFAIARPSSTDERDERERDDARRRGCSATRRTRRDRATSCRHPDPGAAAPRGRGPARAGADRSTVPSSWTSTPPRRASSPARAGRAAQERGLGERLRLRAPSARARSRRSARSTPARRSRGRAGDARGGRPRVRQTPPREAGRRDPAARDPAASRHARR